MNLGERIRDERKRCGLSQEALSLKINVSRQTIYNWENNLAMPDLKNLKALSEAFGITTQELLDEKESTAGDNPFDQALDTGERMIRKHWRKGGYLLVLQGGGLSLFGLFTLFIAYNFFKFSCRDLFFGVSYYTIGNSPFGSFEYVFYGFGAIILIIGIVLIVSGILLIIKDKKVNNY